MIGKPKPRKAAASLRGDEAIQSLLDYQQDRNIDKAD